MKKAISQTDEIETSNVLIRYSLNTVCREATCPNRHECFRKGTATFLILGKSCTRNCRFCDIHSGSPELVDSAEPEKIASASKELGLKYVVLTSVTRDDLPDGGSGHFAKTISSLHKEGITEVEVLVPDFQGSEDSISKVLAANPSVFNHNVETVPRLYPFVRPEAEYHRSVKVLKFAADKGYTTKSGLMLGLGEQPEEGLRVIKDLAWNGVKILTLGQYLAPSPNHFPVKEFVAPARFDWYREKALFFGIKAVASGPFVRSSYKAKESYESLS